MHINPTSIVPIVYIYVVFCFGVLHMPLIAFRLDY